MADPAVIDPARLMEKSSWLSRARPFYTVEKKKNPQTRSLFSLWKPKERKKKKKKQAEMDKIHTLVFGDASEQLMQLSALFLPNGRNHWRGMYIFDPRTRLMRCHCFLWRPSERSLARAICKLYFRTTSWCFRPSSRNSFLLRRRCLYCL